MVCWENQDFELYLFPGIVKKVFFFRFWTLEESNFAKNVWYCDHIQLSAFCFASNLRRCPLIWVWACCDVAAEPTVLRAYCWGRKRPPHSLAGLFCSPARKWRKWACWQAIVTWQCTSVFILNIKRKGAFAYHSFLNRLPEHSINVDPDVPTPSSSGLLGRTGCVSAAHVATWLMVHAWCISILTVIFNNFPFPHLPFCLQSGDFCCVFNLSIQKHAWSSPYSLFGVQ